MAFEFVELGKKSSRAIYLQLLDIIKVQIQDKRLQPGELLPSEHEFCDHYGISRTTVRQTFRELEEHGLIVRRRGLGTYISEPKVSRQLGNLYSFSEDMRMLNLLPSNRILSYRILLHDECSGGMCQIQSERLIEVVRLRLANKKPMLIEKTYLPVDLCPDLSWERLENCSLYAILTERYGLTPYRAVETYEATVLTKEESQHLESSAGEPAFLIRRSTWDEKDRMIEYTTSVMPGSRSKFEITMYQDSVHISRRTKRQSFDDGGNIIA